MQNKLARKNKRAISSIVASILIVFLSITALALVWKAISPAIAVDFSPQVSCLQSQLQNAIKIKSACFDEITSKTMVRLERSLGSNIDELGFIFNGDQSESFVCSNNENICSNCKILEEGEVKDYYFTNRKSDSLSIKSNGCIIAQKDILPC